MNLLDMRTVVLSYFVTNTLITGFIAQLWVQNRQRYVGLGFWLVDFILQAAGFLLLALRGVVPDLVSVVIAQTLIAMGILCIYIGLAHFLGQPVSQLHNYLSLGAYVGLLAYFTFVQPDISIRTMLISAMTLLLTGQCGWMLLRRAAPALRPITRDVGGVLLLYAVLAFVRILDLAWSPLASTADFFDSPAVQVLFVFVNQLLGLALTFTLIMMVTRRLEQDVQTQAAERGRAEQASAESQEHFRLAFRLSPNAMTITRVSDGQVIDVNEGFTNVLGYSSAESIGRTTLDLNLWADVQDRARLVAELSQGKTISGFECRFRKKDGELITGLLSANTLMVRDQLCLLSSITDITARKQMEEVLKETSIRDALTGLYNRGFFEEEMARLGRGRRFPISVIMADVNGLKETNDRDGHAAGDALLQRVARVLEATFRTEDVITRIGGDEFAILLANTDAAAAHQSVTRLRRALEAHNAAHGGLPLSIALGASTAKQAGALTEALNVADAQMYADKVEAKRSEKPGNGRAQQTVQ